MRDTANAAILLARSHTVQFKLISNKHGEAIFISAGRALTSPSTLGLENLRNKTDCPFKFAEKQLPTPQSLERCPHLGLGGLTELSIYLERRDIAR